MDIKQLYLLALLLDNTFYPFEMCVLDDGDVDDLRYIQKLLGACHVLGLTLNIDKSKREISIKRGDEVILYRNSLQRSYDLNSLYIEGGWQYE